MASLIVRLWKRFLWYAVEVHTVNKAVHSGTGKVAEYPALLRRSVEKSWGESNCQEIGRLWIPTNHPHGD